MSAFNHVSNNELSFVQSIQRLDHCSCTQSWYITISGIYNNVRPAITTCKFVKYLYLCTKYINLEMRCENYDTV